MKKMDGKQHSVYVLNKIELYLLGEGDIPSNAIIQHVRSCKKKCLEKIPKLRITSDKRDAIERSEHLRSLIVFVNGNYDENLDEVLFDEIEMGMTWDDWKKQKEEAVERGYKRYMNKKKRIALLRERLKNDTDNTEGENNEKNYRLSY